VLVYCKKRTKEKLSYEFSKLNEISLSVIVLLMTTKVKIIWVPNCSNLGQLN